MFGLYKVVQLALRPELWAIALVAAGWLAAGRRHGLRLARLLLAGAVAVLAGLGSKPVSDLLVRPLESRYPAPAGPLGPHDAIVVLGGGAVWTGRGEASVLGTPSLPRLVRGVLLWREGVAPLLVVSGGSGEPFGRPPLEAPALGELAVGLGVPPGAVVVEDRSRTTWSNAVEVRRRLPDARRIVLVTQAVHLRRAVALFRAQGFEVTPVPSDWLSTPGDSPLRFVPSASTLARSGAAIHEHVGYAAYRIGGRL